MKRTSQLLRSSIPNRSREATNASLLEAIPYTTGKVNWSGESPHHWSVQSFTLSPTPTLNRIFLLKTTQPIRMLLYKPHLCIPLSSLEVQPPHSSPNFRVTTLLQSLVFSTPNRHSHFPSKALLKWSYFLWSTYAHLAPLWLLLLLQSIALAVLEVFGESSGCVSLFKAIPWGIEPIPNCCGSKLVGPYSSCFDGIMGAMLAKWGWGGTWV